MTGDQLAGAVAALIGAPFRTHGRDPTTGLDCIGVLAAALKTTGYSGTLPNSYRLRNHRLPDTATIAEHCGFFRVEGQCLAGDVLVYRVSPCQFHLAIALGSDRCVHAHAGLRRVVLSPTPLPWPILQHWRPTATA